MSNVDVSVVLACYNEGPTLERSITKIVSVLKKLNKKWEIIFVEDKSSDYTKETIYKLSKKIENSKVIFHKKNEGRGKSVSDGIKVAKGDICGYLDVDLEVGAHYISLFTREIEKGSDLAVGNRFYEGEGFSSIPRYLASKTYSFAVHTLLNISISDTECGYKFFRRSKILPIITKVKDKRWFWDTEVCARAILSNLKVAEIPVLFLRRKDKKSTVKLLPDTIDYIVKLLKFRSEISSFGK